MARDAPPWLDLAMRFSPAFRPWLSWLGVVAAGGVLAGLFEPAGLAVAGTVNALGCVLWSLWLIATRVTLLRAPAARPAPRPAPLDPAATLAATAGSAPALHGPPAG